MKNNTLHLNSKIENKPFAVLKDSAELFQPGRHRVWKKGDVTTPKWLKRDASSDFITIKDQRDFDDVSKYLSCEDDRLCVEYYNAFSTGTDKLQNPMLILYDQDDEGNQTKRAMIVVVERTLAMAVVQLVDQFCNSDHYDTPEAATA